MNPSFLEWLADNGVDTSNCVSKIFECGRGLAATKDIEENEIIVSIPENLLLTPALVNASHPLFPHKDEFTRDEVLVLVLLYEKSKERRHADGCTTEGSFWKYYIESLPTDYNIPSYWSDDDFAMLAAHDCCAAKYTQSRKEWQNVYDLYQKITRRCALVDLLGFKMITAQAQGQDLHTIAWNEVRWAHGTVWTRSCTYRGASCLVPFADLLNHHPDFFGDGTCGMGSITAGRKTYSLGQHYIFRAAKRISKNDQCFICYGQKTNWDLLVNYGFALPNGLNPFDLVPALSTQMLAYANLSTSFEEHPDKEAILAAGQMQADNWYVRSNELEEGHDSFVSFSMEVVFRTLLSTLSFDEVFMGKTDATEPLVQEKLAHALQALASDTLNAIAHAKKLTNQDIAIVLNGEYMQLQRVILQCAQ